MYSQLQQTHYLSLLTKFSVPHYQNSEYSARKVIVSIATGGTSSITVISEHNVFTPNAVSHVDHASMQLFPSRLHAPAWLMRCDATREQALFLGSSNQRQ